MIICHCNVLTEQVISQAIDALLETDPYRLITPGLVYKQLGKSGKCCGCFPQVIGLIVSKLELFQTRDPDGLGRRISGVPVLDGRFESIQPVALPNRSG